MNKTLSAIVIAIALFTAPSAFATTGGANISTTVHQSTKTRINSNGMAIAGSNVPDKVKKIMAAGNKIAKTPYVWGGGHGSWSDRGYDCSGSVSFALHGANLLRLQLTSGELARWGKSGKGKWVTVYANSQHTFMHVAGLRFDTSGASPSRWQRESRNTAGYTKRHPNKL